METLQEAVRVSFEGVPFDDSLFKLARAIKAFQITTGVSLKLFELESAVAEWWNMAKSRSFDPGPLDECQLLFLSAFDRAKSPLGSNALEEAIKRASTQPPPPECTEFSGRLKMLVAVCYHLQKLSSPGPFFIGVRDAQRILEAKSTKSGADVLKGLVLRGILKVEMKGTVGRNGKATRYRFTSKSAGVQEYT